MSKGELPENKIYSNGDIKNSKRRNSLSAEDLQRNGTVVNGHHPHNGISNGAFNGFEHAELKSGVNNAITNAPSRHTFIEPNVYAGGRTVNTKRHRKHKRSKTPDFDKQNRKTEESPQFDSILSRLDYSIRAQFGDWNEEEDSEFGPPAPRNNCRHTQPPQVQKPQRNKEPYGPSRISPIIPAPGNYANGPSNGINGDYNDVNDFLSLPRLFKPYDNVMKNNKVLINDPIYKLSKDNNDPNSILSQAKRTLTQVGPDSSGSSNMFH